MAVKMGDLPWDPKFPKNSQIWAKSFEQARALIKREARWSSAFAAIVTARDNGELAEAVSCYKAAADQNDRRLNLWQHVRDHIFGKSDDLPGFAKAIWDAVPQSLAKPLPQDDQDMDGWPLRKVLAFKTTVLFIAGLLEGKLSPSLA